MGGVDDGASPGKTEHSHPQGYVVYGSNKDDVEGNLGILF